MKKVEMRSKENDLKSVTSDERVTVNKAWKMFVGGEFVRSESGRTYVVKSDIRSADPESVNIPLASRKDIRDAILIAKNAQSSWSKRSAYNRGQILYRLAEMMEARFAELVSALFREGIDAASAEKEVVAVIDRTVYYAGFTDKYASLLASSNPVAGPHFAFSVPESLGVFAVLPSQESALLSALTLALPLICAGNTVIAMANQSMPRVLLTFAEMIATSDLPKGVFNLLSGDSNEAALHFASHRELDGLWADNLELELSKKVQELSADSMKRLVLKNVALEAYFTEEQQGLSFLERATESKAIWHPKGI